MLKRVGYPADHPTYYLIRDFGSGDLSGDFSEQFPIAQESFHAFQPGP